jgi:hypothetical protein
MAESCEEENQECLLEEANEIKTVAIGLFSHRVDTPLD